MRDFDPAAYGAVIAGLLRRDRLMPLDQGRPDPDLSHELQSLSADRLFAPAPVRQREMAEACLSGLWLYADDLDRSHRISQGLHDREGSYWHGMMHRREGDYSNAKYWFRRVGGHPIHEALGGRARRLAGAAGEAPGFLQARASWDPAAFVDLCEDACTGRNGAAELCRKIQQQEWHLLFDYCYRRAVGHS